MKAHMSAEQMREEARLLMVQAEQRDRMTDALPGDELTYTLGGLLAALQSHAEDGAPMDTPIVVLTAQGFLGLDNTQAEEYHLHVGSRDSLVEWVTGPSKETHTVEGTYDPSCRWCIETDTCQGHPRSITEQTASYRVITLN